MITMSPSDASAGQRENPLFLGISVGSPPPNRLMACGEARQGQEIAMHERSSLLQIGVVGNGVVGGTLAACAAGAGYRVSVYDIEPGKATAPSLPALVAQADELIFVCTPTPMRRDGSCDTSSVEAAVRGINAAAAALGRKANVLIKSTVPPGTNARLVQQCPHLHLGSNPEFVREQGDPLTEFLNAKFVLMGGDEIALTAGEAFYRRVVPLAEICKTSASTSELCKYVINTFLAGKVSFANEIFDIARASGVDYDELIDLATRDARLGSTHFQVPGPDGSRGFGGSCFPKDLRALTHVAHALCTSSATLLGAWSTNLHVRPQRDWELLRGRAVVDSSSEQEDHGARRGLATAPAAGQDSDNGEGV